MVSQPPSLEIAEEELKRHKVELESQITERTNDLIVVNKNLLREINEKKEVEKKVQKSQEKYRTILESIEEGYYELNQKEKRNQIYVPMSNVF